MIPGFPAYNMQAIVDADKRFRNFSIRPGSFNDQMVLNYSKFGRKVNDVLPLGKILLGDSGYKIRSWIMVPYDDSRRSLTPAESLQEFHVV